MAELQKYTSSEIALNSSKKNCWLVIRGKVYDVTNFLEEHPGGEEPLLHASASGDATEAFEDVGHSSSAVSMMENYLIGTIDGYIPRSELPAPSASKKLQQKQKQQQQQQPSSSYSYLEYIFPLLIVALAFGAWYYLTFHAEAKP